MCAREAESRITVRLSRGGLLGGFKKSHFALEASEEEFAREPSE